MTEKEKFVKVLREQLLSSRIGEHIGQIQKFAYLKDGYVVINLEQLNLAYCEKFIDPKPEHYYTSFIRFCGKAMSYAYKQAEFGFIFAYNNTQVIKHVNLNNYRDCLVNFLASKFPDFEFEVDSSHEITIKVKSYVDNGKKLLESKVEQAVYNFNRYNPTYLVHAATYFSLTDYYGNNKHSFLIGF